MRVTLPVRSIAAAILAAALVGSGAVGAQPAAAQAASQTMVKLPPVQLLRSAAPQPGAAATGQARLQRRSAAVTRPPISTWNVTYTGFTPEAHAAFQAAVDTWAGLVASDVPINVCATFKDLGGEGVLGQAGPSDFVSLRRDGNGGTGRTYYPLALANALTRTDLSPPTDSADPCSGADISADFSSTEPCVYYGTDGAPPARCTDNGGATGYVDFQTIVLHELGHGLGFLGSADVESGFGYFGTREQPDPTIYDRFVAQSAGAVQGKRITSYTSGTTALGTALTSDALYWDGPAGKAANRGRPVRLYAPGTFAPASSFSHLYDTDFPAGNRDALMTPFIGDGEVVHEPGEVVLGMFGDTGWAVPQPPGVRYTPVEPVRIMDTRNGTGGLFGRLGTGRTVDLSVVGGSTGVPTSATAVVLNVTGVGPATSTDLRIYPTPTSGSAQPLVSNLNLRPGAIRANLVTVPVGDNGRVRILNSGGAPHVLADVQGWYGPTGGAAYEPTSPVRLLDTRDGTGGVPVAPVQAGGTLDLTVTGGPRGVPGTAVAVVLTVTAVNAAATTDVRVYPTPSDATAGPPEVSNINLGARQIVPNLVIAKVGAGGAVRLRNSAGQVDLLADLAGWFDAGPDGALFHVLAPQRVLDTRTQVVKRLSAGQTRDVPIAGVAGVPSTGAEAVVVNLTGVDASQTTDVAVYPTPNDSSFPLASNLNLLTHETAADLAVVATGLGGQVRLRNSTGDVGIVLDVTGWFGP
ncbi:MAG: hypothetical protein JJD92_08735 [Frankiaceae bacterium]|nr:hypothetical protein [Frankiaceae bacterium]